MIHSRKGGEEFNEEREAESTSVQQQEWVGPRLELGSGDMPGNANTVEPA